MNFTFDKTHFNSFRSAPLKTVDQESLWPLNHRPRVVYVAASINATHEAAVMALELIECGVVVNSRWIRDQDDVLTPWSHDLKERQREMITKCDRDLEDLESADTLVVMTDVASSSGGFWFELGWWLGAGRRNVVMVGGSRDLVFCAHPAVRWVKSKNSFLPWFRCQIDVLDRLTQPVVELDDEMPF